VTLYARSLDRWVLLVGPFEYLWLTENPEEATRMPAWKAYAYAAIYPELFEVVR